ncbi:MAG: hypothetical protein JNK57_00960 [Planctomycetaceae bacterium]|nr:hypothetical protein [Planctomycetaceae bacterium]
MTEPCRGALDAPALDRGAIHDYRTLDREAIHDHRAMDRRASHDRDRSSVGFSTFFGLRD